MQRPTDAVGDEGGFSSEDCLPDLAGSSESDEEAVQHLRRSARVSRPTAKVKERHQRNLMNQRIQTAYISTVERLGGVLRSSPAQVVRALQSQFPYLQTKDVQSLHRMLKKQNEQKGMEEGMLPGESEEERVERWNAPENVDARAFDKRWYERSVMPTCHICHQELGQDVMTYVYREDDDGTFTIVDETVKALYEAVEKAIATRIDRSATRERRHWLTYKHWWDEKKRSAEHQWVCHKCVHQFDAHSDKERRPRRRRTSEDEEDGTFAMLPDNASVNHLWPGTIPPELLDLNRTELSMIAPINPVISYVCLGGHKGNPQVISATGPPPFNINVQTYDVHSHHAELRHQGQDFQRSGRCGSRGRGLTEDANAREPCLA